MKITLVLTDSPTDCRKALEWLDKFGSTLSAEVSVFMVLEELYRLEQAGVSLNIPIPPDAVREAKERAREKVRNLWKRLKRDDEASLDVKVVVGKLGEEVPKLLRERGSDMVIWGCDLSHYLCDVIGKLDIPSLIIK